MEENKVPLVRILSLWNMVALVIGSVIGGAIFLKPAVMAQEMGSPGKLLVVWIAAGLVSFAGALTYAELAVLMPHAGGDYVFLRKAYGDIPAFLYGWTQIAVTQTGSMAALSVGAVNFLAVFLPVHQVWAKSTYRFLGELVHWEFGLEQLLALALILLLSTINCKGIALGGRVQTWLTAVKITGIILFIFSMFFSWKGNWMHWSVGAHPAPGGGMKMFGLAMIEALWVYDGWNSAVMVAGEVREPQRTIPRALLLGMLIILGTYLLINIGYLYILPFAQVISSQSTLYPDSHPVGARAAQIIFGPFGEHLIAILFVLSTLNCLNGTILASARIPFAMARDGLFFEGIAALSPTTASPTRAIRLQALWACILAISGSYDQITDFVIFALWIFYTCTTASVFVLRAKMPDAPRPYRTPGYPVLPLAFGITGVWLIFNTLQTRPVESFKGLVLIMLGLPLYFYLQRTTRKS